MNYLPTGQFFGETDKTFIVDGITLTDTEYTVKNVDWHYHECPYFTFIIEGNILEGNKKSTHNCTAGTLLFHNWQESHFNVKPDGYTRGFQVEAAPEWFERFDLDLKGLPSYVNIQDPQINILFHNIYKETKLFDEKSNLAIEGLFLEALLELGNVKLLSETQRPAWVKKAEQILRDDISENHSLTGLSSALDLHPTYLCRAFPKFFRRGFGEYLRKVRIEKSLVLLRRKKLLLTEVASACGFADQSHFIRCFKSFVGVSPKEYRNIFFNS
jgi:AraC family transcriptional regulator